MKKLGIGKYSNVVDHFGRAARVEDSMQLNVFAPDEGEAWPEYAGDWGSGLIPFGMSVELRGY